MVRASDIETMAEITIGDVYLQSDGNFLTISRAGREDEKMCLDASEVEALIDFLVNLRQDEPEDDNRRMSFRVPIPVGIGSGLSTQVKARGKLLPVTPKNISMTGILVKLPSDYECDFEQFDELELVLRYQGRSSSYQAQVRNVKNGMLGLYFPETKVDGEIEPPEELADLVMELQRQWLSRRKKKPEV